MNPFFLIPFSIELLYDWKLIERGKPDLHWSWRMPMFLATAIDYSASTWSQIQFSTGALILCLLPYFFFDIALNKLRGKSWDYLSTTNGKYWDRNLVRLNPWFLLVLRFIAAGLICWLAWELGKTP
jgi:hypothetical protein